MSSEELLKRLAEAVRAGDESSAAELAKKIVEAGVDPLKAIDAMAEVMKELGDKFEKMEIFLPELMLSADAMKAALEVLRPKILPETFQKVKKGTVVIGTIQGDIHDIGKTIVALMLQSAGFEVYDLGRDVPIDTFIEAAEKHGADIIAVSTLMTACRGYAKELVEILQEKGVRDKYKLLCGGGGLTPSWALSVGYDAFGEDAFEAIEKAEQLMKEKRGAA